MYTVRKPAGVLMPYGSAVWSSRPVVVESFAAIIAYQMLPNRRAHPMPGQTCVNTILKNESSYSPLV